MSGYVVCDCGEVSPTAQFVIKLKISCQLSLFGFAFNAADSLTDCCVCIYIVKSADQMSDCY